MPPELKQEKCLIGISHSTDAITFMPNLSSGERSRAILALLFKIVLVIAFILCGLFKAEPTTELLFILCRLLVHHMLCAERDEYK